MAAEPRWRCLSLPELEGQVTVRPLPQDNAGAAAGGDEDEVARVLALEGGAVVVGEWVESPEEESSDSDSGGEEEDDEDDEAGASSTSSGEDGRERRKPLPRLALQIKSGVGGEEGAAPAAMATAVAGSPPLAVLETVGWSVACALTHALAHKSLVRGGWPSCIDVGGWVMVIRL